MQRRSIVAHGKVITNLAPRIQITVWGPDRKLVKYPPVPAVPTLQQWFIDCVLGKAEDPAPAIWGLRVALLYEALYESARTGRPVKVQSE